MTNTTHVVYNKLLSVVGRILRTPVMYCTHLLTYFSAHCRGDRVTPTSSRGGSRETDRPSTGDGGQRTDVVEMSEEELRRKTKSIIDEYLHLNDLKVCNNRDG